MIVIVSIVAIICTGLVAGIFLGHRAGVSLAMPILSPSSFVQLQQIIHRTFARMMPVLVIGSVLSSVLWVVLLGVDATYKGQRLPRRFRVTTVWTWAGGRWLLRFAQGTTIAEQPKASH